MERPPLFSFNSIRLRIGLLITFGLWSMWSMRLNLNMAVPCMVNASLTNSKPSEQSLTYVPAKCSKIEYETIAAMGYEGSLQWTPAMQAMLFSSNFYATLVTSFFSGYMADRFGAKILLIMSTSIFVIVSILSPTLANFSYYAFFGARLIMGLAESFCFPCIVSLAARWFPPQERSTMAAIYSSGIQISSGFSSLISSYLCTTQFGWPAIFYFFALMGCIWILLNIIFITNTPAKNNFLSDKERLYLTSNIEAPGKLKKEHGLPLRQLLSSKEVFAVSFCQFSCNAISNLFQSFIPTFIKEVLVIPIHLNGFYTMVPFCAQLISKNTMSPLSDYLRRRGTCPTKLVKIFQTISGFGSAITAVLLCLLPTCDFPEIAIPILALYGLCFSCLVPGYFTAQISIAPAYSGTLNSIGSFFGTFGNLLGPLLLSAVNYFDLEHKWLIVFGVCGLAQIFGSIIFLFCGSGEILPWVRPNEKPRFNLDDCEQEKKIEP